MTRKKIAAGNWKMFTTPEEGVSLATQLAHAKIAADKAEVILFPPATHIMAVSKAVENSPIEVGAQNFYFEKEGAFTGEVSVDMIKGAGATYALVGHSERRQYFGEDAEILTKKTRAALQGGLKVVYCIGENLEQREADKHFDVVAEQIKSVLHHFTAADLASIVIAYEPVWAIGTGKTASPEQAQEIHAFIRKSISDKFGENAGKAIRILYGGSVKPDNAAELFTKEDIDGGLVGGASLKAADFERIIEAASK